MDQNDSEFVEHLPCGSCGSSDANSLYSDGHTYCFACATYGKGNSDVESVPKQAVGLLKADSFPSWRSRGLTAESCRKWGLGISDCNGPVRIFPYTDKTGATVAQKVRGAGKAFKFIGQTSEARLFGQNLWGSGGKMVVVTEGEIDAVSISQVQGHKWPVVSVPNGAQGARKALQKNMEWLCSYETVVLWFDNDDAGRAAVEECAPLFRPGQCKTASMADYKDANEALCDGKQKEIITAIWQATVWRPDGIVSGSDLWETLTRPEEKPAATYPWKGIQEKTHGIRPGEVVTLTAGSGVGKSALVRELALGIHDQGYTVGMLMFEETIKRTALGLMGLRMNKNLLLLNDPQKENGFEESFRTTVGSGRCYLYDHFGSTGFDNVLDRIRYMAIGLGVKYVFLDHLSILVSGMKDGDERRLIDNAMTALKTVSMETQIGLVLVSHLRRPEKKGHEEGATTSLSQLRGSHAIAQLSDFVIGLERDQQDELHRDVTQIRVLKNRFTGETGIGGWLSYDRETGRLQELGDDPRRTAQDFAGETF